MAGIDGSTNKTGIAIFMDGEYKEHTLIDLHKITIPEKRISTMMVSIKEYLDNFDIDKIIMEKSVFKTNIDTVQKLSMLAGSVVLYAAIYNIEFENPIPSIWRKKCGLQQSNKIKRDVLKAESIKAVEQEYNMTLTDDEAEAILIARSGFDLPKISIDIDGIDDTWL